MPQIDKQFAFTVTERRKDGGRIVISTGGVDRDKDRVFPQGAKTESYLANPVVLWGHNGYEPWAVIGRTRTLEVTESGLTADFELREPATDADPMHIISALWEQELVRAASIGFRPDRERTLPNDFGGLDFLSWELLEWSIVPIPANADALRLAAKSYPDAWAVMKRGRVLSSKNEGRIRTARDELDAVLGELDDDDGKAIAELKQQLDDLATQVKALQPPPAPAPAPIDTSRLLNALRGLRTVTTKE
jgi:HK97 family phage prohead protease